MIATPKKVKTDAGKDKGYKVVSGYPPRMGAGDNSPIMPSKIPKKPRRKNLMSSFNMDIIPKTPPMLEINRQEVAT